MASFTVEKFYVKNFDTQRATTKGKEIRFI